VAPNAETRGPRTYGNWRRPTSAGLGSLGTIGTGILLGGLILVILTMTFAGILAAIVLALVLGVSLSTLMIRNHHGTTLLQGLATRAGWLRTRAAGAHLYRSGPLGRTEWGRFQLPGLAAGSTLLEARDSYDRPFALLRVPSTGHYTVAFSGDSDGASLVDEEQIDLWVAHWGQWLAALGDEPGVVAASVTIETAPDTGSRLRREVEANIDPDAPAAARAMLAETVETYPAGSATVRAIVAVTFSGAGRGLARRRDADEMARDLAARVPWLSQGLHATGAGAARPLNAQQLCEIVRTAYDPRAARIFDHARAEGVVPELRWPDVGPSAAEAGWDLYRHDGAWSVTWSMTQAPRGEVQSRVLERLLRPHPDIDRKRVTLLYRPLDSARAARIVEQDKRNADFRVNSAARPPARALVDQRAAAATAAEEARGAGLVNFGMLVTATVTDRDRLDAARQAVDHLAPTARIMLRPVYGSQDSAFAAALPLGLVLPAHLKVPSELRESL
jgi:hypothetical protein